MKFSLKISLENLSIELSVFIPYPVLFMNQVPLAFPEPPQPTEEAWHFIEDLKSPLWRSLRQKKRRARRGEVSLHGGVHIHCEFPDPSRLLETAHADLKRFFDAGKIRRDGGYPIFIRKEMTACHEAYRMDARKEECVIAAQDTEGIRRGIFFLQDEILRTGGAFLPRGRTARQPQIRTRLSRCFFGPISRPPKQREELLDDMDYYPDEYLNRLAHQGVNGLWLTESFSNLYPSKIFPGSGKDSGRRLEKLRRTVRQCARYGIKIYVFCIEPRGFGNTPEYLHPFSILEKHPELAGHRTSEVTYFCPASPLAQAHLEASTHHIFSQVPDLGGMMGINLGERPTHCCSGMVWHLSENNCPRCSRREPWEVFRDTLEPLRRGMIRANPDAELISWLYVPYIPDYEVRRLRETEKLIEKLAVHFPTNVTLQYNFESMGTLDQLGKTRFVRDYSLAYVGPSGIFRACAKARKKAGQRMAAKLQVGCSHEVATVPFVPVPGNLYEKYRALHDLEVSGVMQSWYFGNYPSLMTKAAGELSFAPFPATEQEFLRRLAVICWGEDGARVAKAWSYFSEAYRQFPANLAFAWYGPVHDAIAWPLHLKRVDAPISPSWLLGFPPSGDRIGECIGFEHTLEEAIQLCVIMSRHWDRGVRLLQPLRKKYHAHREHLLEIGVAQAMGLQIRSARNVLKFYDERAKFYASGSTKILDKMRGIVEEEIANSTALEKLARADARLGFHSEAEGYKYFPAKLRWRTRLLKNLLRKDFPKAMQFFQNDRSTEADQPHYDCVRLKRTPHQEKWKSIPPVFLQADDVQKTEDWRTIWRAAHDGKNLHLAFECRTPRSAPKLKPTRDFADGDYLHIAIEPQLFHPTRDFYLGSFGARHYDNKEALLDKRWRTKVTPQADGWQARVTIPLTCLPLSSPALARISIERLAPALGRMAWIPHHSTKYRLIYGNLTPEDFGTLHLC